MKYLLRVAWLCFSGLWLAAPATLAEPAPAKQPLKTLTFSTIEIHDSQDLQNFSGVKLLARALENLGYRMRIIAAPAERSLRMASTGQVDGELLRIRDITYEFEQLRLVPEPIQTSKVFLITRSATAPADKRWRSLNATQLITVQSIYLSELIPLQLREVPVLEAPNYSTALKMLQAYRGDALLLPEIYLSVARGVPGVHWDENFVMLQPALFELSGYVHLHQRHHALVAPLSEELKRLKESVNP